MEDIEINMIVKDSLNALRVYEEVFNAQLVSKTNLGVGLNEVTFKIQTLKIHILDENKEYGLIAPTSDSYIPFSINITTENIQSIFKKAMENNFYCIQKITEILHMNVKNAVLKDEFGYTWILHEII